MTRLLSPLALLAALVLAACDDVLVRPARSPVPVALSIAPGALQAAAGVSDAYDSADRVRVLVLPSLDPALGEDDALLDTTALFAAADSVRLTLELTDSLAEDGRTLGIVVILQADTAPLFAGADEVRVRRSAGVAAHIHALVPVVARFGVSIDRDTLAAPGDTTRVRVAGLFATGDTVPAEFVSIDVENVTPEIIGVGLLEGRSVLVTGLAPGRGRVIVHSTSVRPVPDDSIDVVVLEPPPVVAVFEQVATGGAFACGLDAAGAAWCWGSNTDGGFGDGTTTGSNVPVPAASGRRFTRIAAGARHACGIAVGGALFCWGANNAGQLGNGTRDTPGTTPTPVAGITAAQVSAGEEHTCAVATDGRLYCWGSNADGRAGAGASGAVTSPVLVDSTNTWAEVSAGTRRTCGLRQNTSAWCFGYDADGGLGDGILDTGGSFPRLVEQVSAWWALSVGATHACGIQVESSQPFCWGLNGAGQMGLSTAPQGDGAIHWEPEFSDLPGPISWIDAGRAHTCTVRLGGTLYCMGDDSSGQLGRGNPAPGSPGAGDPGWDQVDASLTGDFTCALRDDGAAYCWGANALGQLGNGTVQDSPAPVAVTPPQANVPDRRSGRSRN